MRIFERFPTADGRQSPAVLLPYRGPTRGGASRPLARHSHVHKLEAKPVDFSKLLQSAVHGHSFGHDSASARPSPEASNGDSGATALRRIAEFWEASGERVQWVENGFHWWPGRFRVSVFAQLPIPGTGVTGRRLVVRTAFLKNVDLRNESIRAAALLLGSVSPTYSWVWIPPEIEERYTEPTTTPARRIWFQTTAYVTDENVGWLPDFIGKMAVMQFIDVEKFANGVGQALRCNLDVSTPPSSAGAEYRARILTVAESVVALAGAGESAWIGSDEFAEIAEVYGKNDGCYGNGDPTGLTLETPFGPNSALIRLRTDEPHPDIGGGLASTVELPVNDSRNAISDWCQHANFSVASSWCDVPQLASWHLRENQDGSFHAANGLFLPNALCGVGIATHTALWQVAHARLVRRQFWPNLEDNTMLEILRRRFGDEVR